MSYSKITDKYIISDASIDYKETNKFVDIIRSSNEESNPLNCSIAEYREVSHRSTSVIETFADKVFCNEVLEMREHGSRVDKFNVEELSLGDPLGQFVKTFNELD